MAKYLNIGFVRELELKLNREEISYSKMVELMEEKCIENYKKETYDKFEIYKERKMLGSGAKSKNEKHKHLPL